jgi:methyl halide transferase
MSHPDWNERYKTGEMPWDTGAPDDNLVAALKSGAIAPGRTLEIGCGTGTNALWLAGRGFDVVAVDLSPLAIDKANAKKAAAGDAAARCRFAVVDFLTADVAGAPFDFVFDRGVFHVFDDADVRARFAARVAAHLGRGGQWLSLIGSTEGGARDTGPPRRTARDVMSAIEPALEIIELRATQFEAVLDGPTPAAWLCRARQRSVPAAPSTKR